MLFPEEIFVKQFLPNVRILLTHELNSKGFTQVKIANILGITQARVNAYLKMKREKALKIINRLGFNSFEVETLIKNLTNEKEIDKNIVLRVIYYYWKQQVSQGLLCKYHILKSNIEQTCNICLTNIDLNEKFKMVEEIKKAAKLIENSTFFHFVMPQVNTNLAYALPNARTINDVLAFPGRLVKIRNTVRSIGEPEFGASKHIASMLLLAYYNNSQIRSCMCIKFDNEILRILKLLNLKIDFNFPKNRKEADPVLKAFKRFLELKNVPDVLIDRGGYGLEPVCYIFGKNPMQVVTIALKIAERYSVNKFYREEKEGLPLF